MSNGPIMDVLGKTFGQAQGAAPQQPQQNFSGQAISALRQAQQQQAQQQPQMQPSITPQFQGGFGRGAFGPAAFKGRGLLG